MKRIVPGMQMAVFLGLMAFLCWCAGCGSGTPPIGSASGKVTYKGQPLTTGVVTFINEKTGSGASGEIDSSGSYRIASIRTGEYSVAIHFQPPKQESPEQTTVARKLSIPDKYQAHQTSGLIATVKEGKNTTDFDL